MGETSHIVRTDARFFKILCCLVTSYINYSTNNLLHFTSGIVVAIYNYYEYRSQLQLVNDKFHFVLILNAHSYGGRG